MNPPEGQLDLHFPSAYQQLRRLAVGYLSRERRDHTLQPTALVHEAFLRLDAMPHFEAGKQEDVIRAAAHAMRLVLVDHARRHRAKKRSGTYQRVPLDDTILKYEERAVDLIALRERKKLTGHFEAPSPTLVVWTLICYKKNTRLSRQH